MAKTKPITEHLIQLVEINTAPLQEIAQIPGVGELLAEKIIQKRPYNSLDDLKLIDGIKAKVFERISPYLILTHDSSPPEPVIYLPEIMEDIPTEQDQEIIDVSPSPSLAENDIQENMSTKDSQPPISNNSQLQVIPMMAANPSNENKSQPLPPQEPIPPSSPQKERNPSIWPFLAACIITLLISVAISLGTIATINRSLSFASYNEFQQLKLQSDGFNGQIENLSQKLANTQARLETLEAVSPRVDNLEKEARNIKLKLSEDEQQLTQLQSQLKVLDSRISKVEENSQMFVKFIDGLKSLLGNLMPSAKTE